MQRIARSSAARLTAVALLGVTASACYQQVALVDPSPPAGTRVVARLTPQGSAQMAPWIGAGASGVEGMVISTDSTRWQLSMVRVEQVAGTDVLWNREPVAFPAGALGAVSERRFQKERSYLAAGAITVGAVLLGRLFAGTVFDNGGGGGGPVDPAQ